MKKILALLMVVSLWPALVMAQTPAWNEIKGELKEALQAKGNPARGEAAFQPCQGCHRKDASGRVSGAYPRLAGQHANVLMKQIADIRSGRRSNAKMEPFIDDHVLTAFDIADIAVFLEALPVPTANGKGAGTALAHGKQLYDKDCADCHGAKGEGNGPKFYPMVAAQHYRYLLREVQLIRDGDRRNANPDMVSVIKDYQLADMEAVSDYMSQFAAPKK
jgi:cytochrome c553